MRGLLVALLAACCIGCSAGAVTREDLIGDFQADYGIGVESLRLASDGHYDQLFRETGDDTWTANSGTWEFKSDRDPVLVLHDSLIVYDQAGKLRLGYGLPVPGERSLRVTRSVRTISIIDPAAPGAVFKKSG